MSFANAAATNTKTSAILMTSSCVGNSGSRVHNYYRAKVATGKERNQPKAADMVAMEWDDRLVSSAQKWSSTCQGWHNKKEDRRFQPYPYTGQNYAGNMGMTESVRGWYDEVTEGNFGFYGYQCSSVCGHYTQVVWGKAHLLGCAQNKCEGRSSMTNVYCEYAPGGNTQFNGKKDLVYTVGEPCSKCPAGFGFCMGGALCASKRACSSSDSKCVCTIKRCENGGVFDAASCSCKCSAKYEGLSCEKECKDGINFCKSYTKECAWDAQMWMWMAQSCRKSCGKCGAPKDGGLSNRQGIKTNAIDMSAEINCKNAANDATCDMRLSRCNTDQATMKKDCARACGFCKSAAGGGTGGSDVQGDRTDSSTSDCKDVRETRTCEYWAKLGECQRLESQMRLYCAKTCEFCRTGTNGGGETGPVTIPRDKTCKDTNESCEYWAGIGECKRVPRTMKHYCAKACKFCLPGSGDVCIDTYPIYGECAKWKARGECTRHPGWMFDYCAKTCGCTRSIP